MIDGISLSTNVTTFNQTVDDHATNLARAAGVDEAIPAEFQDAVEQTKRVHGLRSTFANTNVGKHGEVVTNYVTLTQPSRIYVYELEMISDFTDDGFPIKIRRNAEKRTIIDRIVQSNLIPELGVVAGSPKPWATDGDLIWSVTDLFSTTDPGEITTLHHSMNLFEGANLTYVNECRESKTAARIKISFKMLINTTKTMSQLLADSENSSQGQSEAAILLRGLNAFLTD